MGRKPVREVVRLEARAPRPAPREPLTVKALAAVECYVAHKVDGDSVSRRVVVGRALEAERLPRVTLYRWLAWHGYEYFAREKAWVPKVRAS
jgi:hypothetical protein